MKDDKSIAKQKLDLAIYMLANEVDICPWPCRSVVVGCSEDDREKCWEAYIDQSTKEDEENE